jgi:2,4-didehydro-3-deoxy-L-rhamnonate hydrolase
MLDLLRDWQHNFAALSRIATRATTELKSQFKPVSELRVHAPVPQPGSIYCAAANYRKHVIDLLVAQPQTQGMTLEEKRAWATKLMDERARNGTPFFFLKPQNTVTGPFDPVILPFDSAKPDWELELGVVIGRRARRVTLETALDYIAGYTVVNDVTLRDKLFRRADDGPEFGVNFSLAKGASSFLPMGPYLVPAAFVRDPQQLRITLKHNGRVMQNEDSADMIFSVARLVEYLSHSTELQPGDVICTGSPAGNGMHYNVFLKDGDVMEGSITGADVDFGTQRNPCVAERR